MNVMCYQKWTTIGWSTNTDMLLIGGLIAHARTLIVDGLFWNIDN